MNNKSSVVIVGGGMVGLTLANLLAENDRLDVHVLDAGKKPVFDAQNDVDLRVSAISPGSINVLAGIGAWEYVVAERCCAYVDMKVWDASGHPDSPETLEFAAAEFALPQLGFIVENLLLRSALKKCLENSTASLRFETTIESVQAVGDRYVLKLDSGTQLKPELLIGADGSRSLVRQSCGLDIREWPHDQKALVTHLRPAKPHRDTARQRFLPEGPLGMLPLDDGRISIVWTTTPEIADEALDLSDADLGALLTEVSDGVLGNLQVDGPRGAFPLKSQHADRYINPGVALIGDAAHTIHPLAGQGVNLGIADAERLASVVAAATANGENVGDLPALRRYERARIGTNQLMLGFMDGLNRLFASKSAAMRSARTAGMYAFNKSGPLRSRIVQIALGIN